MDIANGSLGCRLGCCVGSDLTSGKKGIGTRLDRVELTSIDVWGESGGTIFGGK
jgi:hypothetical protein